MGHSGPEMPARNKEDAVAGVWEGIKTKWRFVAAQKFVLLAACCPKS
jgi:hypothetical protein